MPTPAFHDRLPPREELFSLLPQGGITHCMTHSGYRLEKDEGRKWLARVEFNPAVPETEQRANLELLSTATHAPDKVGAVTGATPGPWSFEAQGEPNLYFLLDRDGKRPLARVLFNGENTELQCLAVLALWDEAHGAAIGRSPGPRSLPTPAMAPEISR